MTTDPRHLLDQYTDAVLHAPDALHLTSEKDRAFFRERHVEDAVQLDRHLTEAGIWNAAPQRLIDVGTGNGIPGIVLGILHPTWTLHLLDSNTRKCGFLDVFVKSHAMRHVHIVCDRAEILGHKAQRETYDMAISRALGKLPTALELALPFIKTGGTLIVSHGTTWEKELARSAKALDLLLTEFVKPISYTLGKNHFTAMIFKKKAPTPERYPRAVGIPEKRPLL